MAQTPSNRRCAGRPSTSTNATSTQAGLRSRAETPGKLGLAYGILELSPNANDAEIRQAYRRMLNRYHPDKLASRASSSEALRNAQEKFHAVRQAYETICSFRKMVNP